MRKTVLSYSAPEIDIFEVVAERGYSVSEPVPGGIGSALPGFGTEEHGIIAT